MLQVQSPFPPIMDGGKALDNGSVYIGTANLNPETSPISVYWDEALTQPAAQPLKTVGGYITRNGTPARVFTAVEDYSMMVRNGTGAIVFYVADVTSIGSLQTNLAASSGAALVGYLSNISGAVARTVKSRLDDYVDVNNHVTGGDGSQGNPWTGWDTAITWAARTRYNFSDGWYAYATSPNFAKDDIHLNMSRGTVIQHTGSGWAMLCDAGASTGNVVRVTITGGRIEGNASSTGGFFQRACSRSVFSLSFRNIPGTCFEDNYGVLNRYYLDHTAFVYGETIAPARLLNVTRRGVTELSSANEYYVIAENCTAVGLNLSFCLNSRFYGGASEANVGGAYIETTSAYNTFFGLDMEVNGAGLDIECRGNHNMFLQCLSTGTSKFQGIKNMIHGGAYNIIQSAGNGNQFDSCMYASNAGAFTETGTLTAKKSVYNATTTVFDNDVIANTITGLIVGTGGVTLDATSIVGSVGAYAAGKVIAKFNNKDNTGTPLTIENVNGTPGNAAACALRVGASSVTTRSINAGGTVNASGADYAEYMHKENPADVFFAGEIVGINSNGKLTKSFPDSIAFMVKSTNPSIVGGDDWADSLGPYPEPITESSTPEQVVSFESYQTAFENLRGGVDRIAYAGRVPVNIIASVGEYIVPVNNGGLIGAVGKSYPTESEYRISVGRVISAIDSDRVKIIVKAV